MQLLRFKITATIYYNNAVRRGVGLGVNLRIGLRAGLGLGLFKQNLTKWINED